MVIADLKNKVLKVLGFSGAVQDQEFKFFKSEGVSSKTYPEAFMEWLSGLGFGRGSLQDRLKEYLSFLGFTGAIQDAEKKALTNGIFYDTIPLRVKNILSKYNATLLLPGPAGTVSYWFQPNNYRESTGQNLAAVDQQVGLVVDAAPSVGQEILANGDFSSSAGWTLFGDSGSIAGGVATLSRTSIYTIYERTISVVAGMSYQVTFDSRRVSGTGSLVTTIRTASNTGGTTLATFTNANPSSQFANTSGFFTATTTGLLYVQVGIASSAAVGEFDNISVRELPGIHASQPTSGFQPYLRKVPKKLGPELVSNGAFDTADGWIMGAGWDISGGAMNHTAPSALTSVLAVATQAGKIYQCSYSITSQSAAGSGVSLRVGSTNLTIRNAVGTYSETMTQAVDSATVGFIARGGSGDWLGSIDNLSVREVLEWTYAWQFDGSDDRYALSSILSGSNDFCDLHAVTLQPKASASTFADFRNNAGTGTHVGRLRLSNTGILVVSHMNDAGTTGGANGPNIGNIPVVVGSVRQGTAHTVLVDDAAVLSTTLSGAYTCTHSTLGARGAGTFENMQGYLQGSVLLPAIPTEAERAILTKFLAKLQGRNL